jgi:hypothetical protein
MSAERIPACAGHLAALATPHLAEVVETALREPGQDLSALLDLARQNAAAKLRGKALRSIMGPVDDMAQEAFETAAQLCNDALTEAMKDPGVWDKRRTAKTRRDLLLNLTESHIFGWMRDRGMNPVEVARLQEKGEAM